MTQELRHAFIMDKIRTASYKLQQKTTIKNNKNIYDMKINKK